MDPVQLLQKLKPQVRSRHEALAALIHAMFLSSDNEGSCGMNFPDDWNQDATVFTFEYSTPKKTLVKLLVVDKQLLVNIIDQSSSSSGSNPTTIMLSVDDYVLDAVPLDEFGSLFAEVGALKTKIQPHVPSTTSSQSTARSSLLIEEHRPRPYNYPPQQFPPQFPTRPSIPDSPFGMGPHNDVVGPNHPIFGGGPGPQPHIRYDPIRPPQPFINRPPHTQQPPRRGDHMRRPDDDDDDEDESPYFM